MPRPHGYTTNTWSGDWSVLKSLPPYFLEFRLRVAVAMGFLVLAKFANVLMPWAMKLIIDALDTAQAQIIAVPMAALLCYGLLRFSNIVFAEIRDAIFGRVTERAVRRIGLKVFNHLHSLDLDYHLSRRTGGVARDIERGTNGIAFLMRFVVFNIGPTLFEIALVVLILTVNFSIWFPLIVLVSISFYIFFSVVVTDWRTRFVREMNEMDNKSNTHAVDSLLNFETVKYFGNEQYEAEEYDKHLSAWETARMHNRLSLAGLNSGQAFVVASSMTLLLMLAANQVAAGIMTLGELTMINLYMMQLFMPLNFLGFVYREIKRALADIEHLFSLLDLTPTIRDAPDAENLRTEGGEIRFEHVSFGYSKEREILHDVSFTVPAGHKVAVVGPS